MNTIGPAALREVENMVGSMREWPPRWNGIKSNSASDASRAGYRGKWERRQSHLSSGGRIISLNNLSPRRGGLIRGEIRGASLATRAKRVLLRDVFKQLAPPRHKQTPGSARAHERAWLLPMLLDFGRHGNLI